MRNPQIDDPELGGLHCTGIFKNNANDTANEAQSMKDLLDMVNPTNQEAYQTMLFSQKFKDPIVEREYQEYFKAQIIEIAGYGIVECVVIVLIGAVPALINGLSNLD